MKVQRADPSLEDTEDTSSDNADKRSFQIVKNVNTAVKINSAFQSTTMSSEDCITVSSPSNPNPYVLPATTSTEISISSASDVSNHLSIPKPDVVILRTNYVTDKPGPSNIGALDSVSVPSPDTVNIVLNESTITPMEKLEALDKWAVRGYSRDLIWAVLAVQHASEPSVPYSWGDSGACCKCPQWVMGRSL